MSVRVLAVEDEALIADALADALTEGGYEACGVADSEAEALRIAHQTHPDIAVVDVRLAPGRGRIVAGELSDRFNTIVLMATAEGANSL